MTRSVKAVSIATAEYRGCPPGVVRAAACPGLDGIVAEPDRQAAALAQYRLIS
jgi:hypothetical protein